MILEHKEIENILADSEDKIFSPYQEEIKEEADDTLSRSVNKSFRLYPNKQKDLVNSVNEKVDDFINDYNNYFLEQYFTQAFHQLEKIMDENNDKKATIINTYTEQVDEMEKLLTSDSEEKYKESIQALINSLKDEQSLEIEKTDDELNLEFTNLKHKFQHVNVREEKDVQVLEDKFVYDIFNSIGNMFNFKK